jgi:hypothetical protein
MAEQMESASVGHSKLWSYVNVVLHELAVHLWVSIGAHAHTSHSRAHHQRIAHRCRKTSYNSPVTERVDESKENPAASFQGWITTGFALGAESDRGTPVDLFSSPSPSSPAATAVKP